MIDLGLDSDAYERFMDTLRHSHRIRLDVRIHDQDEKVIGSLRRPVAHVLSGSITYDTSSDVSRALELTLLDPHRRLRFESDSPIHGAVFADRFVSVLYEVWVPDVGSELVGAGRFGEGLFGDGFMGGDSAAVRSPGSWVSVPVFWGPLTSFERVGAEITLEAQGKESLMLAPNYVIQSYMLSRSSRLDDAIRKVAEKAGESRFRIPDLTARLQHPYPVPSKVEPWKVLAGGVKLHSKSGPKLPRHHKPKPGEFFPIERSHLRHGLVHRAPGHQTIFYDGNGRLCVRKLAQKKALVLMWGRDLLSVPSVTYDALDDFRNTVIVEGKRTKANKEAHGAKTQAPRRAKARAQLPKHHPLSPRALSRNGVDRHLTEFVETELGTDAKCEQRAQEVLKRLSTTGIDISFDCLPIPHLEEHDRIEVRTPEFSIELPLTQWTLPLSADSPMSIGEHKRVKRSGRKHRQHHQHRRRRRHRHHHGGQHHHGGHGHGGGR